MRIVVTGSSGFLGSALASRLQASGREVHRLVRRAPSGAGEFRWDPGTGELDAEAFEGVDAVVHLAGENIGSRWTASKKRRIWDSRVHGTHVLAATIAKLQTKPAALVSASAAGYYGDRGDEVLTEDSAPGTGFLADVCRQWEAAAEPASQAGVRVVHPRFGVVLGAGGGALAKMLLPFKLGVGGPIGDGRQVMSWVALDDALSAVERLLADAGLSGAFNVAAPQAVTNAEFAKTLGRVLGRPAVLPLPAFAAKLALGDMAEEALLAGQRVEPKRLRQAGFEFRYPELEPALRRALHKEEASAA